MDLIGLDLRYLNLIVIMVEAQVRWHKCVYIYMGLHKLFKKKKKKKP